MVEIARVPKKFRFRQSDQMITGGIGMAVPGAMRAEADYIAFVVRSGGSCDLPDPEPKRNRPGRAPAEIPEVF